MVSVKSVVINYADELGRRCAEVLTFRGHLVQSGFGPYRRDPGGRNEAPTNGHLT